MNFLQDLLAETNVLLNITQKGILAACASSQTPQLAFEATNGSEQLVVQRAQLHKLGLAVVGDGSVTLTQAGQQALVSNNLVDEQGQLTPDGKLFMDGVTVERTEGHPEFQSEGFSYLRDLLNEGRGGDR